jgi:hypothetical protein
MGTLAFFASSYVISNSIPGVLYRIAPMTGNMTCQTARCGHQARPNATQRHPPCHMSMPSATPISPRFALDLRRFRPTGFG